MDIKNRVQKLRQKLAEKEIDAILISQPENRYYLSGFNGSAGYLFISGEKAVLATDFRYTEQARLQAPDYEIFRIAGNTSEWFLHLAGDLNIKKLGFESGHLTFATYQQLIDILIKAQSAVRLVPVDGVVESLRTIKEAEEVELITRAIDITDRAFEHIRRLLRPGITELELAWEIEKFMREHDSQSVPFEGIIASDTNSALPHAKPTSQAIKTGVPVIADIGSKFNWYGSDLTRTFYSGKPDEKFRKVYETVLEAQLTAISNLKPGMTGSEVDRIARQVIEKAGYGEAFGHGLGHGVGLATHELPRIGPNSTDILSEGMVFTIEPGIYLVGWGGVRIEDDAIIEDGKVRVISKADKYLEV